jgi:hypothetical protein
MEPPPFVPLQLWIQVRTAVLLAALLAARASPGDEGFRLATFSADVTVPLGHRLMGVLPVKAREVVDPLEVRGLVLQGPVPPVVIAVVDWCELRNGAYDRWREALAAAAGTSPERVLLSCAHQHDAPVADLDAERLLAAQGLGGELCDPAFHQEAVRRAAAGLRESLGSARQVTHVGLGEAQVERIASNRRVVGPDGKARFDRGSSSGGDPRHREAPEGLVDPWIKTLSFWDGDTPVAALSSYATHPMSYYGRGGVSADFVGMARRRRQAEAPGVFQVYTSGASGDVTAGKYNDGSTGEREALAARLARAMRAAWDRSRRLPLVSASLRVERLDLPFHEGEELTVPRLERTLADPQADVRQRILAAMALASRSRVARGQPIDLACLDLGAAQVVLFPGEAFVGYQLLAQRLRSDSFVVSIGYGECWPGYIPTRAAFGEGFGSDWRWVAAGAADELEAALGLVLRRGRNEILGDSTQRGEAWTRDVFAATGGNPRYSEGSVLALRDGSLLYAVTEFRGEEDDFAPARIVSRRSADGGRTWGEARVLQENVGRRNVMSASLARFRTAGASGIGLFYLVKDGPDALRVWMRLSTDEAESFGAPVLVTRGEGYHVMNNDRVVQLLDGRLLCPVAWTRDVSRENHFASLCHLSDDGGLSWRPGRCSADLPQRGAMEPEVVELAGGELLMILRTQLGEIHASRSRDRGDTWSAAEPWGVASPESPATLRRIPATGDLLLVWNPHYRAGAGHGGPRTPLRAAVSTDGGRTWLHARDLESSPDSTYAYTSLTFFGPRALLSYYVRDETSGRISSRFRSVAVGWFYGGN